eukprot:Clim_evm23s144 gene=Clim_evmTU23s144
MSPALNDSVGEVFFDSNDRLNTPVRKGAKKTATPHHTKQSAGSVKKPAPMKLTKPVEFTFASDARVRARKERHSLGGMTTRPNLNPKPLRPKQEPVLPPKIEPKLTVPKPFRFQRQDPFKYREENKDALKEYKPLCNQVKDFNKLVQHENPQKTLNAPTGHNESTKKTHTRRHSMTIPCAPNLMTSQRLRYEAPIPTTEQREFDEMKKFKPFKATPLDRRILQSHGDLGVRKVSKRPVTVPHDFHFASDNRIGRKPVVAKSSEEEECTFAPKIHSNNHRAYGAQPRVRSAGQPMLARPPSPKLTIPQTPNFASKNLPRRPRNPTDQRPFTFRARPAPKIHSQRLQRSNSTDNVAYEGSRSNNYNRSRRGSDSSFKSASEDLPGVGRPFKAQPLPSDSPDPLPYVPRKEPTQPVPFRLQSDERGERYKAWFDENIQAEEQHQHEQAEFKASHWEDPKPFVPARSNRPLTEAKPHNFRLAAREQQWKVVEAEKQRKEAEAKKMAEQQAKIKAEREREEIRELRRQREFKATPVGNYRDLGLSEVEPKALTQPKSPNLRTKSLRV